MPCDQFLSEVFAHFANIASAKFDIEYSVSMADMSDAECLAMAHILFNNMWPPQQVDISDEAHLSWPADHIIADGYADHCEFARRVINEFQWHFDRLKHEAGRREASRFSMTATIQMHFLSSTHNVAHAAETQDIWHTMTWDNTSVEPINWIFDLEDVFVKTLKKYVQTEFKHQTTFNLREFSKELVAECKRQDFVFRSRRARRTGGFKMVW